MERFLEKVSRPEDLAVAIEAAQAAGDVMNRYRRKESMETDTKGDQNDPVTEADFRAQERIVEIIGNEFPDDGFRGEEDLEKEGYSRRNWVVDPIDGTSNFERGIPHFCTSIGLEVDGELVLGVVYSPESALDEMFFACNGSGAYRVSSGKLEELEVSGKSSLESAMVLGSINEREEYDRKRDLGLTRAFMDRGAKFRRLGSAALNLCHVASGEAEAVLYRYLYEWDYAAGKVIIEEVGGETGIWDTDDERVSFMGTNSELHERMDGIFESFRPG
jgi:myo-inositol-1(or 4)-monophosphatase